MIINRISCMCSTVQIIMMCFEVCFSLSLPIANYNTCIACKSFNVLLKNKQSSAIVNYFENKTKQNKTATEISLRSCPTLCHIKIKVNISAYQKYNFKIFDVEQTKKNRTCLVRSLKYFNKPIK